MNWLDSGGFSKPSMKTRIIKKMHWFSMKDYVEIKAWYQLLESSITEWGLVAYNQSGVAQFSAWKREAIEIDPVSAEALGVR